MDVTKWVVAVVSLIAAGTGAKAWSEVWDKLAARQKEKGSSQPLNRQDHRLGSLIVGVLCGLLAFSIAQWATNWHTIQVPHFDGGDVGGQDDGFKPGMPGPQQWTFASETDPFKFNQRYHSYKDPKWEGVIEITSQEMPASSEAIPIVVMINHRPLGSAPSANTTHHKGTGSATKAAGGFDLSFTLFANDIQKTHGERHYNGRIISSRAGFSGRGTWTWHDD